MPLNYCNADILPRKVRRVRQSRLICYVLQLFKTIKEIYMYQNNLYGFSNKDFLSLSMVI